MTISENKFYGLGIAPGILAILKNLEFTQPTSIQEKSIPPAILGKDLIGIAETGTGKTLAFGIPMIQHVTQKKDRVGLVVLPTRELAMQVEEALKKIGQTLGIKTALLIGGPQMGRQITSLRNRPNIIIGTPGRIIDHLNRLTLTLTNVDILVLDEADRMLDMGFAPQLKKILHAVSVKRQTLLFSATMPNEIISIARTFMKLPLQIEIAPPGTSAHNVTHEVFMVGRAHKGVLLQTILKEYRGSVLVFTHTKYIAKRVASEVRHAGHSAVEMHSNRSQNQRREALSGFRSGKYRVLVATDIAARGIDVQGIELVVNYDLPEQAENYVHRIGRTGRAGEVGHAISFATLDQHGDLRAIERLIKKTLPIAKLPSSLPPPVYEQPEKRVSRRAPQKSSYRGRGKNAPHARHGSHRPHRNGFRKR